MWKYHKLDEFRRGDWVRVVHGYFNGSYARIVEDDVPPSEDDVNRGDGMLYCIRICDEEDTNEGLRLVLNDRMGYAYDFEMELLHRPDDSRRVLSYNELGAYTTVDH